MESISSVRASSFYIWGRKRQAQWPFVLRLGAAKASSARASAASGPLHFTFGGCKGNLSESISSRPLRFTFGGCKGDLSESISSIRAPSFYIRASAASGPLHFTFGGGKGRLSGPFVLHLGAAKATSARASAASGPLRFTLGGCKGNLSKSISSIRAPSFYIWALRRQPQREHQQHHPFDLHLGAAKAGKGDLSESISSIRAPSFYI